MTNKLTQIQAKVREVCPELRECWARDCDEFRCEDERHWSDCQLHNVLRAIGEGSGRQYEYVLGLDGHILEMRGGTELGLMTFEGTGVYWNLTKPLHEQDDSVLDFLFTILCHAQPQQQ